MEVAKRRPWGPQQDQVSSHKASTTHPMSHQFCELISTVSLVLKLTKGNLIKSSKGSVVYFPHGTMRSLGGYLSLIMCVMMQERAKRMAGDSLQTKLFPG